MNSSEIFDSILTHMIDTLIVVDPSGAIQMVNRAALNLLGYGEQELVGKPMSLILGDEDQIFMLKGLIEAGSVQEFELVYVNKDGRKIPMSCTGSALRDVRGDIQGIVYIAEDITERKQTEAALKESEERFRTLFENVPIGVYRCTLEGRILTVNPALVNMLRLSSSDELMQLNLEEISDAKSREELRSRLQSEGEVKGLEGLWKRKDGTPVYVSENAKVVRDTEGAPVYYEGTVEDISERKKIEQLKNEFVSIVSHELRVPLTSIRGSLSWIADKMEKDLPENARKMIEIGTRSSERMVRLINDMLDLDQIESGKMPFHWKRLPLMPLIEQAIEANQSYADQFGVKFAFQEKIYDAEVNADSDRLMQVLTNLLANAAKFSPQNGVVIVNVRKENGMVRVEIQDRGPGIPDKFKSRIFQKFAQARNQDGRQQSGSGLGLSISKVIVEKLGGTINFESREGSGTTFYFLLPRLSPIK
jgi:PAS domain S-box-containing protein